MKRSKGKGKKVIPVETPIKPVLIEGLLPDTCGSWPLLVGIPIGAVLLLSALLGLREIFSPDIGFYLNMGKVALEEGRVLFQDEWTYSRVGAVVEHSPWLFGLIQWGLYKQGGTLAMVVAHTALVLLVYLTLVLRSRADLGRLSPWVAPWLLLFSLGSFWEIRPHTFSWLGLSLVCWAVESWSRGERRWIWLVPLMMPLWVNIHSLFVLGLAVLGIFALAEVVSKRSWSGMGPLLGVGVLAGLACFLTPYWKTIATFPIKQFFILSAGIIPSETTGIREFLSPFRWDYYTQLGPLIVYQWVFFVQISGVIALVALFGVWKKRRIWEWVLFAVFGYLFFKAVKNHGYFMVATFPMVVAGLDEIGQRGFGWICRRVPKFGARWGRCLPALGVGLVLLAVGILWLQWQSGYLYQQDRSHHRAGHQFNAFYLPIEAAEFMRKTLPAEARVLNNWDVGGYLAWTSGRKVLIDGRYEVMGEEFYREYLRFKNPRELDSMLKKWEIQAALVPVVDIPLWFHHFHTSPHWRLVYSDPRYALFYRKDCAPHVPEKNRPMVGVDYPDYNIEEKDRILRLALTRNDPGLGSSLFTRHYEPREEIGRVAQYLLMGENRAAACLALSGLQKSTFVAPDLLVYLGHAFFALKEEPAAFDCYQKGLRYLEDSTASQRIRGMKENRHD